RPSRDASHELAGQPRLADAGRPEEREQVGDRFGEGPIERPLELGELALPADKRGVEPASKALGSGKNVTKTPRRSTDAGLVDHDGVTHEGKRVLAEEDLARPSGCPQLRGKRHRLARNRSAFAWFEEDLARGDSDSSLDHVSELRRRPHGAQSVVLVELRDPEHGE